MLINLLARQQGIVSEIHLRVPANVELAGRVVCLADRSLPLDQALLTGATAIGSVPVCGIDHPSQAPSDAIVLTIGPGPAPRHGLRVHGDGWWGAISTSAINAACSSALPLGPYVAACLAAGEVFKHVRLPRTQTQAACYSLWTLKACATPPAPQDQGPEDLSTVQLRVLLAGCGAVGSAFLAAAWAMPALAGKVTAADSDKLGVDLSNLNRCVIFGRHAIGEPKAKEAQRVCFDMPLEFTPHDGSVQDVADPTALVASAVDTNQSREAIQSMYPGRLLSASTLDLRAELLRCDPLSQGACLRCFNRPESETSDREIRRRYLAADPDEQARLATEFGLSLPEARRWATTEMCSYATDRLMEHMRESDAGPEAFAVGFVSVLSGLMLFAQTLREHLGVPLLAAPTVRASLTFLDLLAPTGIPRAYAREDGCPACQRDTPALSVWQARHASWISTETRCPDRRSAGRVLHRFRTKGPLAASMEWRHRS
jgi:hypothetical protein